MHMQSSCFSHKTFFNVLDAVVVIEMSQCLVLNSGLSQ